jgi:hypothetical protein
VALEEQSRLSFWLWLASPNRHAAALLATSDSKRSACVYYGFGDGHQSIFTSPVRLSCHKLSLFAGGLSDEVGYNLLARSWDTPIPQLSPRADVTPQHTTFKYNSNGNARGRIQSNILGRRESRISHWGLQIWLPHESTQAYPIWYGSALLSFCWSVKLTTEGSCSRRIRDPRTNR